MREKTALITGGATGIGKRTAFQLAEKGVHLAINYNKSKMEAIALANELTARFGTRNIALNGDITKLDDCQKFVEEALSFFPVIDILIHNAGPYIHERKTMTDYSFEEWNYLINGNLNAIFYLSKLLIPGMRENRWGRMITVGFDRVETAPGWIYRSAFAAAKSGAASLTKTIALEEANHGITVNMVCPGDIIGDWKEKEIVHAADIIDNATPVGRPGTGEDIARVISFLVDESSDFITGSIIPVTGGKDVLGKVARGEGQDVVGNRERLKTGKE
ncbi:SDR family oxidoreductase [Bacillus sp. FJAT-29790]|uniref:SDR family oxidoreductase n=1 Tax=Bacillus sp. FJAT-29790 TaxID=1895002 RepID=UPI001C2369C4|nr:SDR family oxidoreductase [Bacillus sp. FJAT-29790]